MNEDIKTSFIFREIGHVWGTHITKKKYKSKTFNKEWSNQWEIKIYTLK